MKLVKIFQGSFSLLALSSVAILSAQQESTPLAPLQGQPVLDASHVISHTPAPALPGNAAFSPSAVPTSLATPTIVQEKEIVPIREAIGSGNYTEAKEKLEALKKSSPDNPLIKNYENRLQGRSGSQISEEVKSPLRTPRPDVTPFIPSEPVEPTPTPFVPPTPVPDGAATPTNTEDSSSEGFLQSKNGKYALYGGGGLLALAIAAFLLKKRKQNDVYEDLDTSEPYTPVTEDYHVDPLAGEETVYSQEHEETAFGTSSDAPASAEDSIFQFDSSPAVTPVTTTVEDDNNISIDDFTAFSSSKEDDNNPISSEKKFTHFPEQNDETVSIGNTEVNIPAEEETIAVDSPDTVSFESLGFNFGGTSEEKPAVQPEPIVEVPPSPEPTVEPSAGTDTVNIDDLLSSMFKSVESKPEPVVEPSPTPEPIETPTLNLDSITIPNVSPTPEQKAAKDDPFAALFAGMDTTSPAPSVEPTPPPTSSSKSIDDLMAETLGVGAITKNESPAPKPSESLDERSERMFNEQVTKARTAMEEKNWKQAVHFLSIAAALHPTDSEAQEMLKTARLQKKLSEESV